jgi:ABC-type polysaccharide/polyol phosphate export permease
MDRRYRHLVLQFALKDFKIRYTNAALGYAWCVLQPLVFFVVYYLVFSVYIRFDIPQYRGYLLSGLILWSFFAEGSGNGITALLSRGGIISKVPMPRHVVVAAAVLNSLLVFAINLAVLGILLVATGTHFGWPLVLLPLLVADFVLLTLGVSLLLAPLHVRYHDIGYVWGLILQVGFWLTPIIYAETVIPERWRWLMSYNIIARLIRHCREVLVYGIWPGWESVATVTVAAALLFALGLGAFQRLQANVVEYY